MRFTAKTEQIPRCIDEIEAHHDLPSMEYRGACVAQRNGTTPSRRSPDLGEAEFRARHLFHGNVERPRCLISSSLTPASIVAIFFVPIPAVPFPFICSSVMTNCTILNQS